MYNIEVRAVYVVKLFQMCLKFVILNLILFTTFFELVF